MVACTQEIMQMTKVDGFETEYYNVRAGQRRLRCGQRSREKPGIWGHVSQNKSNPRRSVSSVKLLPGQGR